MSDIGAGGRRLRIAVLSRRFTSAGGGAEGYSVRLVEQLAGRHEIHVFAQEIAHQWPGVSYHRVPFALRKPRWINQLGYAIATARATRQGFDVVHSHENTWRGNIQTIHVKPVRDSLLAGLTGWRRTLRWLKIAASPRLAAYLLLEAARFRPQPGRHVVVTSSNLLAQAVQAYPRAAEAMTVIVPGVQMPTDTATREEARQRLGLPGAETRVLLFVANDFARKGLATLLAALVQLPGNVHLAVVGDDAEIGEFRQRAQALGIAQRVHFLGKLADMAPAYRAADALAHPTLEDTFAMVVLEAMAHGLPVVVSGPVFCGISTLLNDGENALLLRNPLDPQELLAAMQRVLTDELLASRLGKHAKEFAVRHDWVQVAASYERMYYACAGTA